MYRLTCRRGFLKSSLVFATTLFSSHNALAKVFDGRPRPEARISLHNLKSDERLTVTYRNEQGIYDSEALKALNWALRCPITNETTQMDLRVIEYLHRLDLALGGGHEFQVISGYRSPAYNLHLRSESHGVAKHSFHMKGKAIDLAIAGIGLDHLRRVARNLSPGGVGYYPKAGFIHMDSGPYRSW
ncbi:hypothetical protein GMSM_39430 [Geomonas sp. Red276]